MKGLLLWARPLLELLLIGWAFIIVIAQPTCSALLLADVP
jgi:hypothetical protein